MHHTAGRLEPDRECARARRITDICWPSGPTSASFGIAWQMGCGGILVGAHSLSLRFRSATKMC